MKRIYVFVVATLMSVAFISCADESNSEKGEKAAAEFCSCLDEGSTGDECLDALKSKYTKAEYTSSDFIDAFNEVADASCGVTLYTYTD
jgi:hypothetical protein